MLPDPRAPYLLLYASVAPYYEGYLCSALGERCVHRCGCWEIPCGHLSCVSTLRYPEQGLTYLTVVSHPVLPPGLANSRFSIQMWTNDLKFKQREALFSEEKLLLYYSYKTFMMGKLRDSEEFQELVGSIRLFVLFKIVLRVKNKIWEDIIAILPTTHLPLTGD